MKFIIYILLIVVICVLYIWSVENSVTFAPAKHIEATPEDIGLAYEDIYFSTRPSFFLLQDSYPLHAVA